MFSGHLGAYAPQTFILDMYLKSLKKIITYIDLYWNI